MREFNLDCLLNQNQWVSSADPSKQSCGNAIAGVCIGLSEKGHELIQTQGLPAFKKQALATLPAHCLVDNCWSFRQINFTFPDSEDLISLQDLPPVISMLEGPQQHRLLLDIASDLPWFKGHFPGYPVLAGIVQLHWAVSFSIGLLNFKSPPTEIARLKYKNVITPPAVVELSLQQVKDHEVQFELRSHDKIHSLGRLLFEHVAE